MGWYAGRGWRLVLGSGKLRVHRQPPCSHDFQTGLTECRWHPTWSARLPASLVSGVYIGKLIASTGAQRDTLFVVRGLRPGQMLAQLSTATYEAYHDYGGDDLYPSDLAVAVTGSSRGV